MQDLEDGLVDMSVGPFWVTADRLKKFAFTVPLYYDQTFLVVKNPATTGWFAQAKQVLMPFTFRMWILILAAILLSALLSVWFSDQSWLNVAEGSHRRRRIEA